MVGRASRVTAACLLAMTVFCPTAPEISAADRSSMFKNGHVGDCAGCHGRENKNRYEFDRAQSRVTFRVDNFGYATAIGTFRRIEGGFVFDPASAGKSSVVATIHADSIDAQDVLFDSILRSERFFDVARFPFMTFMATRIETTGPNTGKITGELTMRGVTRPVALDVTFNKAGSHPVTGRHLAGFSATGTVKRSDFGMTLGLPGIGDTVNLSIEVVGRRLD